MSKKQANIKLTADSTVFYREEEEGYPLCANIRDNGTIRKYVLDHSFDETWQAALTRKAVLKAGEIDPAKWELVSEVTPGQGSAGGFTPPSF